MIRLRPAHSAEDLDAIYPTPHDHTRWQDHIIRIDATIDVARKLAAGPLESAADLSCGSGAVLAALDVQRRHLGDYAAGYEYTGPIEQTLDQIPHVDLFVCTETLEHLDDPSAVLQAIRPKTDRLVLSTPVDNWDDVNLEHYWAWSADDVHALLWTAGFTVVEAVTIDFRRYGPEFYCFGIWGCR